MTDPGPATLHGALAAVAGRAASRAALSDGDGVWLSYDELQRRVETLARGLGARGVARGDSVALLEGGAGGVIAFFAVLRAGGVAVPLSPALRQREVAAVLDDLAPALVLTADSLPELAAAGEGAAAIAPPAVAPEDLATILYTTGTTGMPRGVMHTHAGLLASYRVLQQLYDRLLGGGGPRAAGRLVATAWRYRSRMLRAAGERTWMTPMPLHSVAGFRVVLQTLLGGQRMLMPRFHPRTALELIARERVSIVAATPAMVEAMLAVGDFEGHDLSSLLVIGLGAAPASPELARRARERFGCPVLIGYGTTETAGGVLVTRIHDTEEHQAETVGLPFPGAEVRVVDERRAPVPPGTPGELACRVSGLMRGYRREESSEAIDEEGWYYTGDLAVMDSAGYVRIVGRKRDLIIRGGHNVVPLEVERVLEQHPGVARAAVVGVPDRMAGERIVAFFVPAPGACPGAGELRAHCAQSLAAHRVPDRYRALAELPAAASGEVLKSALRQVAAEERIGG